MRLPCLVLGILCIAGFPAVMSSQTRMLDDFEELSGWRAIVSEGAKLDISSTEGRTGRALMMDFDLSGVYGYVIAQKDFAIDLPSNYQFTFDMRGETQVNNFEFKLMDDHENVFWIKKLNIQYPKTWSKRRIRKRNITFAWGPERGSEIHKVRKIEFVVSCGSGGKGQVCIDNFRFEPIDDTAGANARAVVVTSSALPGGAPRIDQAGNSITRWRSKEGSQSDTLTVAFNRLKECGGLVIDWDTLDFAKAYSVALSDDGKDWSTAYEVANGGGGRRYIPLADGEGRYLRLTFNASNRGRGYAIASVTIKDARFSATSNDLFRNIAADAPEGYYPKYLLNKQSYWTVVGVNGDDKEALINEQGQIEVDKQQFSLEPFLYVDGRLMTWSDVSTTPSLMSGYLPIPSVQWRFGNDWIVSVEATAAGVPGRSLLGLRYTIESARSIPNAKLFIAIRPFQVNPPWQGLNTDGGVARIDSIVNDHWLIDVNGIKVIPMTRPSAFGAVEFDQGVVTEFLARGSVPAAQHVHDHSGFASAALEYDLVLQPEQPVEITLAVPFHGWQRSPVPAMSDGGRVYYDLMRGQTAGQWEAKIGTVHITLPPTAQDVINTIKSNLGYIFINRDGAGIQPGSRSYDRSWIRDGALTSAALLRTGNLQEVREFIDWYAKGQFPSGKIPCVIDSRGPDAVPEHDSNGEFIYAVYQYFLFSRDTVWLRGKFDAVVKTVRFIQSLRAERKTPTYKSGTPEQRALYGLVTQSISHEGYWDTPRHSYWDDFFVLRGLKDAASIAAVLGEKQLAREFAAERDDLRKDLYASMRLAMKNTNVDYIPGCAELGDFDATSTTIGVYPGGELGNIPEPQLHNTFDRYYKFFEERKKSNTFENYTPYETRVIGTFVQLGQKKRAEEALNFFMHDRRPPAWNQWAEVVWRDPRTPKFIGDMPHTWVGSDFIRSVLSMFIMEREKDDAHVLCAGIPDRWVLDSAGVKAHELQTYYGYVSYTIHATGKTVFVDVTGKFDVRQHKLVLKSPLLAPLRGVKVNGAEVPRPGTGEILLKKLPVRVELSY